jgi:hypothetical protein
MLTTLAFLAALPLAPAQSGSLQLTNPRFTYGILGPVRPDAKVLPGDNLALQFDIENVSVDKEGKVKYSTSLDVLDPGGKSIFMQAPREQEVYNTLGGNSLPGSAAVFIGLEQAPGEYTLKVTVTDTAARKSATLAQKFQVLPKAFGFIGLNTTSDVEGRVPSGILSVGESLFVNVAVIGFSREGAMKQPNLVVEMRVLDDKGQPTLPSVPKVFTDVVDKDVPEKAAVVPFQFLVSLNRPGKFTVELKATDKLTNKTVTQKLPFTVVTR